MTEETLSRPLARHWFFILIRLCKAEIALVASLSAVAGLCLSPGEPMRLLPLLAAGVWLAAGGACALNQYQERHTDALMPRTARRPLPAGLVRPAFALGVAIIMIVSGTALLAFTGHPEPPLLTCAAVLWYNGFYTRFKARSAFAAVPGAGVGALPPAIGWTAGGGSLADFGLILLCFFLILWQILHFLVFSLAYAREYEEAGLPSLASVFSADQLKRLVLLWLIATAVSAQMAAVFLFHYVPGLHVMVMIASFYLALKGVFFLYRRENGYASLFREANNYLLLVLLAAIADRLAADAFIFIAGQS